MWTPGAPVTVRKCDHQGCERVRYSGVVIDIGLGWLCMDAVFALNDHPIAAGIVFRRGDRLREWHYVDRWYNVFAVYDVDDDALKCYYCNITRPAIIDSAQGIVQADDLALDLLLLPDGAVHLLDEDQFRALSLSHVEAAACWDAVAEIRRLFAARTPPFDADSA